MLFSNWDRQRSFLSNELIPLNPTLTKERLCACVRAGVHCVRLFQASCASHIPTPFPDPSPHAHIQPPAGVAGPAHPPLHNGHCCGLLLRPKNAPDSPRARTGRPWSRPYQVVTCSWGSARPGKGELRVQAAGKEKQRGDKRSCRKQPFLPQGPDPQTPQCKHHTAPACQGIPGDSQKYRVATGGSWRG